LIESEYEGDSGMFNPNELDREGRRRFLTTLGAVPAAMVVSDRTASASRAAEEPMALPRIQIGPYTFSRLICGANPFHGGSHLSGFLNRAMKEYYSPQQILQTLRRCQDVGINTWQSGMGHVELYKQFVDQGLQMQFIAIAAGRPSTIDALASGGCIGIAHHGEVTDRLFKSGQIDKAHDYIKRVRDAGLLVGVSTHMPDVIDTIESKGWDLDYYMCCLYERHRSKDELERLLGQAPIPVGEVYLPSDPPRMFKAINQTERPCLAFKLLAAGRLSDRKQWVEQAFRKTFESLKPTDGAIIGIYDRYSDQPAECAAYVRRFGSRKKGEPYILHG
jgi:hypothetical protein